MLKEMVARIGYLRMVTPRRAGDRPRTGASRYVFRAGKLEEGNAAREKRWVVTDWICSAVLQSAWCASNLHMRWLSSTQSHTCNLHCRVADGKISMEEAWTKHNQLMRRQYFGQDPPKAPGIF